MTVPRKFRIACQDRQEGKSGISVFLDCQSDKEKSTF